MGKIEKAVTWAINIANDNRHGYSQSVRWGDSYDCSSLVISAWQNAGVPVKSAGATYTGNMRSVFLLNGFKDVTASCNLSNGDGMKRGDVLLNEANHTALYIGSGMLVHARSSEGTTDTADNSGNEIRTQSYWNYPWDCVLRYTGDDTASAEIADDYPVPVQIRYMQTQFPIIKPNMSKIQLEAVRMLQAILNAKGEHLTVDGYYGISTQTKVYQWQKAHNLLTDKEVGAETWKSLITEANA